MTTIDNRWQLVTCSRCGKSYICTPEHDYYNATSASDGVCETCLTLDAGVHPDKTVTLTVICECCQSAPAMTTRGIRPAKRPPTPRLKRVHPDWASIPPSPWRVRCPTCGTVYVGQCPTCNEGTRP